MHDVLKANSAFQDMLRGMLRKRNWRQPIRHEVLAAIILMEERFWGRWFAELLDEQQRWMVAWAIAAHHLQMDVNNSQQPLVSAVGVPSKLTAFLAHGEVKKILGRVCELLGKVGVAPDVADVTFDLIEDADDGLERTVARFVRQSRQLWRSWRSDRQFKRDLAILKALLIAADVAGSALPVVHATREDRRNWMSEQLNRTLDPGEAKSVVAANLGDREALDFQRQVAASEHLVTIVTAGCGNGKTTAAYMWAQRWARGRKLFFSYPTTGTASAGFRDYLLLQPIHRRLIHGRSEVDLASMLESEEDVPPIERAQRLESLNAWGQQAISCTVDTVLGLIQNQRRPLFAFPAIIRGAFVFDEVHSYDKRMFAAMLRFLQAFPGIPALIMSASIPESRLEALRVAVGDRMNQEPIRGDQSIERIKRYRIHERMEADCWGEVDGLLAANNGKNSIKVLWVCNTVSSAVAVYKEAKERLPSATVLLFHSRYRYKDRVDLQDRLIDEFQYGDAAKHVRKHARPAIAITTQVCEMSLDISADLLVSACCPLPSLVQRLGRLNRYASADDPRPAFIYEFSGRPYNEDDAPDHVGAAMQMVREIEGKPCDQVTLAGYISRLQSTEELPEDSAWLDGGWESIPLPAREGDNSITVVRSEDIAPLTRPFKSSDVIPLTIPMIFKRGFSWTERAAGFPVAGDDYRIDYDWNSETRSGRGASWR